jgi:UDP-N-acetylglucosamine/UDP-N-acetylgalactosamine diphosphorylase
MSIQKSYEKIKKLLKNYHQGHLLAFWDQLNKDQKQNLLAQVQRLDFEKIDFWVTNIVKNPATGAICTDFTPAFSYNPVPAGPRQQRKYTEGVKLGKELISSGKVAAFVVAGGQGTRLGFDGPKGDFPISPVEGKTLFQIFAETISAVSKKYQADCPWYVMTSPLNHDQTVEIFRKNNYYGLDEKNVFIFQQGTLPNFGSDGRILLADKSTIACSPDGHGGSLKALYVSGALDDMKRRGIEYLSYWQVDNPLIKIFDPLFVGLHVLDEAEMSSKAVIKTGPFENVGNFCLHDGKLKVVEYSEFNKLPDDQAPLNSEKERSKLAERKNPDGSLVFVLGSIAIHIISRSFVENFNSANFSLPLHKATKEIPHIDEMGNEVESDGIKLESFIFDALPLASKSVILQTIRSQEFAPTKNATGEDSVETARQMMVDRAADWLESAGVTIPRKQDGSVDCLLEIAPSFALEKEDIKEKLDRIPKIKPEEEVYIS